jgi:histidyl-tRNA synthetase
LLTKAVKGAKDILPSEVFRWQYLEKVFADTARRFGFSEIRVPVFEHTELFARGVGDTSDIVQKQMYTFDDMGGRSLTLRPEGTAGVARAFIENKLYADTLPAKLWYELSCYRYEKPQSGRLREFHQFGIEIFGSTDMKADAEVIGLASDFLGRLGIKELELRINSIGCPECRPRYREALQEFLRPKYDELCDTCKSRFEKNPMRILDCKSPVCQELAQGAPVMLDYICDDCATAFDDLKRHLGDFGIEYTVDPGIVRGLDYYSKTAFEFVTSHIGAQGTVCGGGRYDKLIEELGGPEVPGVGFGLGIERLLLLMESMGLEVPAADATDVMVVTLSQGADAACAEILNGLREAGVSAVSDVSGRGMKAQMKYADRIGAKYAVILGDEEVESRVATVKDLGSGEQRKVAFAELVNVVE